ncbi:hypothetical protein GWK77_03820 [Candidatus Saccharibacteria bacterium oral taxon 488]|nr:hypothetical protein GWK77_03820 [Candidatus Saccharibacteria bacterium oral taxon 488]QJU07804.1 hypothetical protein FBF29_03855 [Candidatus Saccharibacteria bacterium oral taxon 488]
MGKERIGGDSSNQGQDLAASWERLAAASNNYGEQQPDEVEVRGDMQGGDETQGEQGVAAPMTLEEFCRIYTTIDNVYNEYSDKTHETKRGDQRQRAEVLANQERQIKEARKEFDRRCREIREAASVQMQQIQESTKVAQTLAVIKEESSKRMNEAIAPLVAADKASDETLRQFIHDFDEQRERGELTPDDVELSYFVMAIAKRNSRHRKDVLQTNADLECEEVTPLDAELGEASPGVYLTNNCEALSGERQYPVLQPPLDVLERRSGNMIEGYVRGILQKYVDKGIISRQYGVYINKEEYHDGVHIWEVRIESNCGGFVLSEDTTNQVDS